VLLGLPEFEWLSTASVDETCALLAQSDERTALIAGGTDLLTKMKHRRLVPRRLINIKKIPGLDRIRHDEREGLRIGALATIQAIEASPLVAKLSPALKQAAAVLGTTQIRNTGTLGGNLANASPSAEFAPPLLTLGASVRCVSHSGERLVPVEQLFVGPGKTVLRRDELLTEVRVPLMPAGARGIYLKHSLRRMDVAIASAAVLVCLDGDVCTDARIALGAVAPTPFRATKAEAALRGQRLSGDGLLEEVARLAAEESVPIDDFRAHAAYRRKLVAMLVGKGLERVRTPVTRRAAA
jgi:carbon-monoxide dehydrogenase medium subunit